MIPTRGIEAPAVHRIQCRKTHEFNVNFQAILPKTALVVIRNMTPKVWWRRKTPSDRGRRLLQFLERRGPPALLPTSPALGAYV